MKRIILTAAVLAAASASSARANDATRDWSGVWVGFGAGYANGRHAATLSDGGQFCIVNATGWSSASCATDAGSARAQSEAEVGVNFATADAEGRQDPSQDGIDQDYDANYGDPATSDTHAFAWSVTSIQQARAGATVSSVPDQWVGGLSVSHADASNGIYAAYAYSNVENTDGAGAAQAAAFVGLFDFGSSGLADETGPAIGGHIGYNHQFANNILVGAEADLTVLGADASRLIGQDAATVGLLGDVAVRQEASTSVDALASLRGRVGVASGRFLTYATGGVGFGRYTATLDKTLETSEAHDFESHETDSRTAVGAVVGGGVSMWLGENAALSGEVLYYHFDDAVTFGTGETIGIEDVLTVSAKISFRFR